MKEKLLLIFTEKIFTEQNINLAKLDEQLQIAFQILVNRNYEVLVSGDGDQSFEFAKGFSYIFQDENIKNTEYKLNDSQKSELMKNSNCIVCFQEEVQLAQSLHRPFILIDVKAKNVGEKDDIEEKFDGFTIDSLNAGEIVKRVEELISSGLDMKKENSIDVKKQKSNFTENSSDEFEEYKNQVKKTIEQFINNNEFEEAKNLISEYESIVKDDVNIYSMKAIIAINENKLYDAKDILIGGVKLFKNNFDLIYNLAYVYEMIGEYDNAIQTYRQVLNLTTDYKLRKEIYDIINKIEGCDEEECCEIIIKNTDNKSDPKTGDNTYEARKSVVEAMMDDNVPLVSVLVLAYNNLEKYTKTCVECILKYTTDVNYELILVDNGSTDGTFEYFKTVKHPRKKIIKVTKNIGATYGGYQGYMNYNSRYFVAVANDIYVTKNWILNMVKCAESDPKIGIVTPVADYISNLQSVNLEFDDFEDMQKKAAMYNISDPRKWEERLRLITLGTLFKKECLDTIGFMDYGFFHDFGDDDVTFRIRRAGYKAILCKDTFVCHAGKITDKGAEISRKSLEIGKKNFSDKYYGIDAWDDVNYEPLMMQFVKSNGRVTEKDPRILGIDVACGGPILEVKNKLRNRGIFNSRLSAFSTEAKYWLDLKTICDDTVEVDRIDFISEYFYEVKFDYIVIGQLINKYKEPYKLLSQVLKLLNDNGQLLLKLKNVHDIITLLKISGVILSENMESLCYISVDEINQYLKKQGYFIQDMLAETHRIEEENRESVKNLIDFKTDNDYNKALIDNYTLNIVKCNK